MVYFDKRGCYVVKKDEEYYIIGTRTSNNCYEMNAEIDSFSVAAKLQDMKLWHRRLGHVNYKLLHKLGNKEIVRGIPRLKKECRLLCGDC